MFWNDQEESSFPTKEKALKKKAENSVKIPFHIAIKYWFIDLEIDIYSTMLKDLRKL